MTKQKTMREWLETLPAPYAQRAISQAQGGRLDKPHRSLMGAVVEFKRWSETREGVDFWYDVYESLDPDTFDALPPIPNDGWPGSKPERDARMVAFTWQHANGQWDYQIGEVVSTEFYSSRSTAKRGLVRFLNRLGVDESAVRWEDGR